MLTDQLDMTLTVFTGSSNQLKMQQSTENTVFVLSIGTDRTVQWSASTLLAIP